jgi:hypothetical protein
LSGLYLQPNATSNRDLAFIENSKKESQKLFLTGTQCNQFGKNHLPEMVVGIPSQITFKAAW